MADMRGYTLGRFLKGLVSKHVGTIKGESGPRRWKETRDRTASLLETMRVSGLLAEGAAVEGAYFVICDQTNNRAGSEEGINIDVGIAPQDSGEFVIARAVV